MNKLLTHLIALAMVVSFFAPVSQADCSQPVYIIAHRCNDAGDVTEVVAQQGVNAIEADFRYGPPLSVCPWCDQEWFVNHDVLAGPLESWLFDVKIAITASDMLALVIFDIKTPTGDLVSLYNQARAYLGPEINLIFSIGDFGARFSFHQLRDALNQDPRAGAAIDYLEDNESQQHVQEFFRTNGITDYWFGDGYTAAVETPFSVVKNVTDGFMLRDSSLRSCADRFHGVYTWTYEKESSIKAWLNEGVNGIFINAAECFARIDPAGAWEPKEVVAYAQNSQGLTGTRFADRLHNPFEVPAPGITCPPSTIVECSAPGGTSVDDPQIDAFFDGVTITSRGCDAVGDAEVAAPEFFYLNEPASVVFTAADEGMCRPSNSCAAEVTVVDTTAPNMMNITATPDVLWPPNGKMVPVTVDVANADICDTAPTCRITSVTSNEPEERAGRGNRSPDWRIAGGLELRAERSGAGDGRIYTITVECADASGNSAQGTVEVGVPHDQKQEATARSRGASGNTSAASVDVSVAPKSKKQGGGRNYRRGEIARKRAI